MPRHSASQICQCIPSELHLNLSTSISIHLSARDSQNAFFVYSIANQHRFPRRFMAELPGDSSAPEGYDAGHARDLSQSPRIGMSSMVAMAQSQSNDGVSFQRWKE